MEVNLVYFQKMTVKNFILFSLCSFIYCAPIEDEITHLPGLNYILHFQHYSGYLDGIAGDNIHYWFVSSMSDPSNDPLILWMNGGPGCSSMEGLFNEIGPYRISADGTFLTMNDYSWNKFANLLFLESPMCVGFSYRNDGNCQATDDRTSLTNYLALQSFFKKFPEFRDNSLFITGESYGGIYIPTLSERIITGLDTVPMNIKGFAVGNGLSSESMNDDSLIFFSYYHGLFGDALWWKLIKACCLDGKPTRNTCHFSKSIWPQCDAAVQEALLYIYNNKLNMYNIYSTCEHPKYLNATSKYLIDRSLLFRSLRSKNLGKKLSAKLTLDPPCTDSDNLRIYLNKPGFQEAIHVRKQNWDICNDEVNYNYITQYTTMKAQYLKLTKHIRGLVYNGDVDIACNFLGDQWFVESLGLKIISKRRPWFYKGQIGGYVKRFTNLDLLTIRGAGHMVPEDKPGPAYHMMLSFINNTIY